MSTAERLARDLLEAELNAAPIGPPTEADPAMSIADAYAVQTAGLQLRLARGATLVGHKVGLTSEAMQEMLGVDQPDFGYLTGEMVSDSGAVLDPAAFVAPRVEAEIAFRLSAPLQGPGVEVEDVIAATEAVAPALEVIDSRVADWKIKIADTIADNASCGHVVIGAWTDLGELDLAAVEADLVVEAADGSSETVSGRGEAVLGHPARAVAWLVRALHEYGNGGLVAGEVVLPGAMARALPVAAGGSARSTMSGLGEVNVRFRGGD